MGQRCDAQPPVRSVRLASRRSATLFPVPGLAGDEGEAAGAHQMVLDPAAEALHRGGGHEGLDRKLGGEGIELQPVEGEQFAVHDVSPRSLAWPGSGVSSWGSQAGGRPVAAWASSMPLSSGGSSPAPALPPPPSPPPGGRDGARHRRCHACRGGTACTTARRFARRPSQRCRGPSARNGSRPRAGGAMAAALGSGCLRSRRCRPSA